MGLQSPQKRSPPEGLGHLEFFFYDSDLLHDADNKSELFSRDEIRGVPGNEISEALMPNWPGYGDEPLTEWQINEVDPNTDLNSASFDDSVNGCSDNQSKELRPKLNQLTDITIASSELIDVAIAVDSKIGRAHV